MYSESSVTFEPTPTPTPATVPSPEQPDCVGTTTEPGAASEVGPDLIPKQSALNPADSSSASLDSKHEHTVPSPLVIPNSSSSVRGVLEEATKDLGEDITPEQLQEALTAAAASDGLGGLNSPDSELSPVGQPPTFSPSSISSAQSEGGPEVDIVLSSPEEIDRVIRRASRKVEQWDKADLEESMKDDAPGMVICNETFLKAQHTVIFSLVKQIGGNLLQGREIMRVSLPVTLFEPRSMLQRVMEYYRRPDILDKASKASTPLERFRYVTTFVFSGLYRMSGNSKPFNPVLGETFEANVGDARAVAEQTCHHPPVTTLFMDHDKQWTLGAEAMYTVKVKGNTIHGHQLGKNTIHFPATDKLPECTIEWEYPGWVFQGLLFGKRWGRYEGVLVIRDASDGFFFQCSFAPKPKSKFPFGKATGVPAHTIEGGIYSGRKGDLQTPLSSSEAAERFKANQGVVYSGAKLLEKATGSWLRSLMLGKHAVWKIEEEPKPIRPRPLKDSMPSDCRWRADIVALAQDDLVKAQYWKNFYEDVQRRDRKLREEGGGSGSSSKKK